MFYSVEMRNIRRDAKYRRDDVYIVSKSRNNAYGCEGDDVYIVSTGGGGCLGFVGEIVIFGFDNQCNEQCRAICFKTVF